MSIERKRKTRGFTLLELTIALTITAITGLSVAGATFALTRAHQDTQAFYQSLQTARSAMLRIQRSIQQSKLVTACSGTVLVLWLDDVNENGVINAEEFVLLIFDTNAGEIRLVRKVFPDEMRDAMNIKVPLARLTTTGSAMSEVSSGPYTQTTVLATGVTDFYATASPNPPLTTCVGLRLTVGTGLSEVTLRSTASPRGAKLAQVSYVDDHYVLNAE